MNQQLFLGLAEDAAIELLRLFDVFEAPRRPQRLRHIRSVTSLVRFSRSAIRRFGVRLALIAFGPTVAGRREIIGGLFARHPHGAIAWSARECAQRWIRLGGPRGHGGGRFGRRRDA